MTDLEAIDAQTWTKLQAGDEAALEVVYRALSPRVFALAIRTLSNREEAEEIVQDTFIRLHREAHRITGGVAVIMPYVLTIARNLSISRLRARRARPIIEQPHEDEIDPFTHQAAPFDLAEINTTRTMVSEALQTLDPLDRTLLEKNFYWGYSHNELAEQHELPLGTIKAKLRRALLRLRDLIQRPQ